MGKIVLLDELTINQIAAGEVIERPASVVKELIENSIDAGANQITVEVKNGGIKQIRIKDNGSGMSKDDLEFAFERHATSKIRTADDLETVKSMGFRGEALASIAAIAHVEMTSKLENEDFGHRIVLEGGDVLLKEEVGANKGTTIVISNLFYNTPVRYKFLKKDYTELGYIEDAVTRIALANPNVSIKLINENKTIIQTTGNGDIKSVIYAIYGKEIVDGLVDVSYEYEDIKVTGVVGKPEIARGNRTYQMFFVNKRFIKDKTLTSSTEQAFKGLLPIGKFGVVILNLEMDPKKIDVNVHPTKLEIRFQEEQKVFKAVYHSIKNTLLKGELVANSEKEETGMVVETPKYMAPVSEIKSELPYVAPISEIKEEIKQEVIQPKEEPEKKSSGLFGLFKRKDEEDEIEEQSENTIEQIFKNKSNEIIEEVPQETVVMPNILEIQKEAEEKIEEINESQEFEVMYSKAFGKKIEDKKEETEKVDTYSFAETKNISLFEEKEEYKSAPVYKYCGTMFSTYIVIEMNDEVYIIDQHAAHERIMYEKVKKNFYSNMEKDSQIMLLPDIIELSHKERSIVKENTELFKKAGFIFEEFGDNAIRLIGVPTICLELNTKELFLNILDEIDTVAITATEEKEDKFIATIACKAAVKANMSLNKEEIDSLMDKLLRLPNPFTCPHGRPTAIKMTKADIEKKFSRR